MTDYIAVVLMVSILAIFVMALTYEDPHIPPMTLDEEAEWLRGQGLSEDEIKQIQDPS